MKPHLSGSELAKSVRVLRNNEEKLSGTKFTTSSPYLNLLIIRQ